jgi:hypothetical protein
MITTINEYEKAMEEIQELECRLSTLLKSNPIGQKGFTKAGVRKLISKLHEELAVYEGSAEARNSHTE